MFNHVVFFKLKEPLESNKVELKRRLLEMPREISQIKEIKIGFNVIHSERSVDVCLHVVFNNREDLNIYIEHPFHIKVAEYIGTIKEASYSADYYDEN